MANETPNGPVIRTESPEYRARVAMQALLTLELHRTDTEDIKAFLAEFLKEHRTNQQNIFRLFVALVEEMAYWPHSYMDGRNTAAVSLAKHIVASLPEWDRHKYLPYV